MLERIRYFLFLFVLQCPPSLLIPLAQHDTATASLPHNLVELGTNHIEEITPKNSKATDLIQQIDVKDSENKVISSINHVAINDESNDTTNENNGSHHNGLKNETLLTFANVTSVLNNIGATNPSNGSFSLLSTNTSGNALKAANLTVLEHQGNDDVMKNSLKSDVNVTNNILSNATIVPVNLSSYNSKSVNVKNMASEVILEPLGGKHVIDKSLIDSESDIAYRMISPVKRKSKNQNTLKNGNSNTIILSKSNNDSSENNDNSDSLESDNNLLVDENTKNIQEKNIFLLLNTGNIDGMTVNSPAKKVNLQTNLDKHAIENVNSGNSKLLNNFVNSTINNILSKVLQRNHNHTTLYNKHLFLILNSGSISNVHVDSPVLENSAKNTNLKVRSRRHLVSLKPVNDESTPIIEMRSIPLDNTSTTVDETPKEEMSSAEAPAYRSLIADKINKLHQISNAVATAIEPNTTKDHNLYLKLIPESPPISIDLNQLPLNNLLGGALSFINRFKRDTGNVDTAPLDIKINEDHTVNAGNETNLNNDMNSKLLTPTRKSLANSIYNVLDLYQRIELVCPLSVIINLYTQQVFGKLATKISVDILHQILSSFMTGEEGVSDFASRQLSELPIKLKLELQMLHGKTKEFIEQLNNNVNANRCSVS